MDKTRIKLFGRQLRRAYIAPDDLPYPMRKALEELAAKEVEPEKEEDYDAAKQRNYAK